MIGYDLGEAHRQYDRSHTFSPRLHLLFRDGNRNRNP
jgi:hypothetical protein